MKKLLLVPMLLLAGCAGMQGGNDIVMEEAMVPSDPGI